MYMLEIKNIKWYILKVNKNDKTYFYPSDELTLFQLIYIVRSKDVLLHHCSRLGDGWDHANMFNSATFCMYMPVPSQEPIIQWLSYVYCYIFVFHSVFVHKLCR